MNMSKDGGLLDLQSPWMRSLVAGAVAGVCTDISLFPLDTLKTRLQSAQGFFGAGGFKNIYRGLGSAALGSAPSAALFFVTYDSAKRILMQYAPLSRSENHAPLSNTDARVAAGVHMIAGSLGEIAGCIIRVPVEVIKQRTQARQHSSSLSALQHIIRSYSNWALLRELYRGGGVTLLREVPFTMIQFPLWEALKSRHLSKLHQTDLTANHGNISAIPSALYGSLAGAFAAAITTPLDVLKTRLMLSKESIGAISMLRTIVKDSGPRALFAGIGPRVAWISAGGAIFLGSYQVAMNEMETSRRRV